MAGITLNSSNSLVKYTYASGNGNLQGVTYGNGQKLSYVYDKYDRVTVKRATTTSSTTVLNTVATYTYNASGQLARVTDEVNARETNYSYDLSGRIITYRTTEGSITYGYDNQDRTTQVVTEFDGEKYTSSYEYLSANRPGVSSLPIGTVNREYDELQREEAHIVTAKGTGVMLRSEVTFLDVSGNRTTELVSEYRHYAGGSILGAAQGYGYGYDSRGNICIQFDLTTGTTITYQYDSLNQLIRENDEKRGVTILYTYDNSGNLLQKDIYSYTTGTPTNLKESISYGYNASAWKDLLTSYNGKTITYDGLGNPITYYNGARFVWRQGRQLTSLTYNGKSISYQYNENGIRIGKKVGTKQTTYLVDAAGTIQALECGSDKLVFFYDSTGRREGFSYYDCDQFVGHFYYLYNAQGDVTNILDETMQVIVTYEYDSWGKVLSCEGIAADILGVLNPFRYRGYIYDEETGFYYLNSRYYDPETGRFINADDVSYLGVGGIVSYNLFAYCENDPVNGYDPYGTFDLNELIGKIKAIMKGIGGRVSVGIGGRFEGGRSSGGKNASSKGNATSIPSVKLKIDSQQLGHKWGKHKSDYPNLSGYREYEQLVKDVFSNPDKIILDSTNGEYFYIQGQDLLRVTLEGVFVSLYPGADSGLVIKALEGGGLLWQKLLRSILFP